MLLPELLDSTRDTLTIALVQFPGIWVSAAIPPTRELFTLTFAIENSIIRNPKFQSLVAFSAAASSGPGAGTAHGISAILHKRPLHRAGRNINE
jgi:hypothetical protein